MTERNIFLMKVLAVALVAFVTAAAFAAYLKPGMLIEFANLVLCT
jgi:multisubunit Na+/H+ antiporter MnhF subunit